MIWLFDIIVSTIKSALYKFNPIVIVDDPTVSPTAKDEIVNDPPSEIKIAVSISTSFES